MFREILESVPSRINPYPTYFCVRNIVTERQNVDFNSNLFIDIRSVFLERCLNPWCRIFVRFGRLVCFIITFFIGVLLDSSQRFIRHMFIIDSLEVKNEEVTSYSYLN